MKPAPPTTTTRESSQNRPAFSDSAAITRISNIQFIPTNLFLLFLKEVRPEAIFLVFPIQHHSFFIVTGNAGSLDNKYSVFGQVVDGLSVVEAIEQAAVNGETPVTRIDLTKVRIVRP